MPKRYEWLAFDGLNEQGLTKILNDYTNRGYEVALLNSYPNPGYARCRFPDAEGKEIALFALVLKTWSKA